MTEAPWDVAIVGAGPAGLAAASVLGGRGHRVVVVDEYPALGGRLGGQSYRTLRGAFEGREVLASLEADLEGLPVEIRLGVTVAQIQEDVGTWILHISKGPPRLSARSCVVATGAAEVPVPFPGWTLPGVLTVGAAQVLGVVWGRELGRRGIVIGTTPLAFAITQELRAAGAPALAVVMPPGGPATAHLGTVTEAWARLSDWRHLAPWWARPGASWLGTPAGRRLLIPRFPKRGLPVAGSSLRLAVMALEVVGEQEVEGIRLVRLDGDGRPTGKSWVEPLDFVLVAGGLRPLPELLQAAGADMTRLEGLGGDVPLVSEAGETTRPGLFAAGAATGVEGAAVALAQGRLAGLAAVRHLGGTVPEKAWQEAREAVASARRDAPLTFHRGLEAAREEMARLWAHQREGA